MTAFRVDDGMYDHPKFEGISDSAIALWTKAGSWCGRYLNGGYVPEERVRKLGYTVEVAEELVSRGIWKHGPPPEMSGTDSTGGFHFHQWHQHQPTKEKIEAERERWREDKRRQRAKPKNKPEMSGTDSTPESRNGMELRESENSDLSSHEGARGVPANDTAPTPTGSGHQFEVLEGFREAWPPKVTRPPLYGQRLLAAVEHCRAVARTHGKDLREAARAVCAAAVPGAKDWDFMVAKVDPYAVVTQPLRQTGLRPARASPSPGTTGKDFEDEEDESVQMARWNHGSR